MRSNVTRREISIPLLAAAALFLGNAFGQGFSGNFAIRHWGIGSNPGGLVDTSSAPRSVTLMNYTSWAVSGSGISYSKPHVKDTVSFNYTTSGTSSVCPAAFLVGGTSNFLSSSVGQAWFVVPADTSFGFALNGNNQPNDFGCATSSQVYFKISDFTFGSSTPNNMPSPGSDSTIVSGADSCKAIGGSFSPSTCTISSDFVIPSTKKIVIPAGITLNLGSGTGLRFLNSGTFVNRGVVLSSRSITNEGAFITSGAVHADTDFTNSGTLKILPGGNLYSGYWSSSIQNLAGGLIEIRNDGTYTPSWGSANGITAIGRFLNYGRIDVKTTGTGVGIFLNNLGTLTNYQGGVVNVTNSAGTGIYVSGAPTIPSTKKIPVNGGNIVNVAGTIAVNNSGGYGIFNEKTATGRGIIKNEYQERNVFGTITNKENDSTAIYNQGSFQNCASYTGYSPLVPVDLYTVGCPPRR